MPETLRAPGTADVYSRCCALVHNGPRWHVRTFDRKTQEFRDFVITRIKRPALRNGQPLAPHKASNQNIQWIRIVDRGWCHTQTGPRPQITEMDYGCSVACCG